MNRKAEKNTLRVALVVAALLLFPALILASVEGQLKVSDNHRYLQFDNGKPFFYLGGDTAWELFQRLNREEATQYLTNHSQKGFTVIQAVVLAPADGSGGVRYFGVR